MNTLQRHNAILRNICLTSKLLVWKLIFIWVIKLMGICQYMLVKPFSILNLNKDLLDIQHIKLTTLSAYSIHNKLYNSLKRIWNPMTSEVIPSWLVMVTYYIALVWMEWNEWNAKIVSISYVVALLWSANNLQKPLLHCW